LLNHLEYDNYYEKINNDDDEKKDFIHDGA